MTSSWDAFYQVGHVTMPSPFALTVASRLHTLAYSALALVDLGCGNGRDTLHFAAIGLDVLGLDNSPTGIASARAAAAATDAVHGQILRFLCYDLTSKVAWEDLVATLDAQDATGIRVYYGRFLLHAVSPDSRRAIVSYLARAMQEGDIGVFEFRTPVDASLPKHRAHERWYVDPVELANEINRLGLQLRIDEIGTGLAPWGNEDPHVARVTITKARSERAPN